MFEQDRTALRRTFVEAWRKHRAGAPVSALEAQVAAAVALHPEYHPLLEDERALERDFTPEDGQQNPFLHLSLHLAVADQVTTNRPPGVREVYEGLLQALGAEHAAQHCLLERLGEALWQAQRDGVPPDEQAYLRRLRDDLGRARRGRGEAPGGL